MLQNLLVVIGAGALPELQMSSACQSLADAYGAVLLEEGCGLSPHPLLGELTAEIGDSSRLTLLRLSGDVGVDESGEGSWMEALAAWRIPVLMLAQPRPDGRFAGIVPASVAFARELKLPLLGLVQLGGEWDAAARRTDGLPWCGCLQGPDDDPRGVISCLQYRQQVLAREATVGSA